MSRCRNRDPAILERAIAMPTRGRSRGSPTAPSSHTYARVSAPYREHACSIRFARSGASVTGASDRAQPRRAWAAMPARAGRAHPCGPCVSWPPLCRRAQVRFHHQLVKPVVEWLRSRAPTQRVRAPRIGSHDSGGDERSAATRFSDASSLEPISTVERRCVRVILSSISHASVVDVMSFQTRPQNVATTVRLPPTTVVSRDRFAGRVSYAPD